MPSFSGSAIGAVEPGTYAILPGAGTLRVSNYRWEQNYEFTAFVAGSLIILPATDFADGPDSYPTLLASNGPRHVLGSGPYLGASANAEGDGQPGIEASDDAGDDGVTFASVLRQGQTATVPRQCVASRRQVGCISSTSTPTGISPTLAKIFDSVPLPASDNELRFVVPAGAESATTYARFRISSAGGLSFDGPADDGEVEDYLVSLGLAATIPSAPMADINLTPTTSHRAAWPSSATARSWPCPIANSRCHARPDGPRVRGSGHCRSDGPRASPDDDDPAHAGRQAGVLEVFEQGPNPQASSVRPLPAAALAAMPSSSVGEGSGEFVPAVTGSTAGDPRLDVNRDGRHAAGCALADQLPESAGQRPSVARRRGVCAAVGRRERRRRRFAAGCAERD